MVMVRQDGQRAHFALTNTSSDQDSWVLDALNTGLIRLASR
jgi:hypothetical protein